MGTESDKPLTWPVLVGVPEVTEFEGKQAYEILVEHFDWPDEATQPMQLEVVQTEEDRFMERLRRAGLVVDVKVNDLWEDSR